MVVPRPAALFALVAVFAAGCGVNPRAVPADRREVIDRSAIDRPPGLDVAAVVVNLTAPTAVAFDDGDGPTHGAMVVVEGGVENPRLHAFMPSGERRTIYPSAPRLLGDPPGQDRIYGPITACVVRAGEVYVAHRDKRGEGVVSRYTFDGQRRTVVAGLPAQAGGGITDLAFSPTNDRLFFGVAALSNSGVVGLDDVQQGWVKQHPKACDVPAVDLRLLGYRFDTRNPLAGPFGGSDVVVTAPFHPFAERERLRIAASATGKPSAALLSVDPAGGDVRVEAHGLRWPAGLLFNEYGNLYVSNQGAELRGTRPVKDDPDSVLRVPLGGGAWYGWPDFSADLAPLTEARFQPPRELLVRTGYPEVGFLVDHGASGLVRPDRGTLLRGVFPSLSGASKMALVGEQAGFEPFRGQALVALAGDRAPFATSGVPLRVPVGRKIARLDLDSKAEQDFLVNAGTVGAAPRPGALKRPTDAKFGPDGALYVVDLGDVDYASGTPKPKRGTGRVLRVAPAEPPATRPASDLAPERAFESGM